VKSFRARQGRHPRCARRSRWPAGSARPTPRARRTAPGPRWCAPAVPRRPRAIGRRTGHPVQLDELLPQRGPRADRRGDGLGVLVDRPLAIQPQDRHGQLALPAGCVRGVHQVHLLDIPDPDIGDPHVIAGAQRADVLEAAFTVVRGANGRPCWETRESDTSATKKISTPAPSTTADACGSSTAWPSVRPSEHEAESAALLLFVEAGRAAIAGAAGGQQAGRQGGAVVDWLPGVRCRVPPTEVGVAGAAWMLPVTAVGSTLRCARKSARDRPGRSW